MVSFPIQGHIVDHADDTGPDSAGGLYESGNIDTNRTVRSCCPDNSSLRHSGHFSCPRCRQSINRRPNHNPCRNRIAFPCPDSRANASRRTNRQAHAHPPANR